ncbi:MAG TPA: pyruvate synthase subunit PorD [Dehalococcoidia bacterium]|nr:pyruvate synthase subunit PorD [Dehalococcoidia bacterium]
MTKPENMMTWKDLEIGSIVIEPGNASQYQTGAWRSQRPIHDFTKCIKCGLCSLFCPEGCIGQNAEGYFEADLFYCKGCGICARECWTRAIKMVEEEE